MQNYWRQQKIFISYVKLQRRTGPARLKKRILSMENLEVLTLYKLIILYMLGKVDYSLTKSQVFDFMLVKNYTDYFTLQKVMNQLTDDAMIESKFVRNTSHLSITDKGRETIELLKNDISESIRNDIDGFLQDNDVRFRSEVAISSDYFRNTDGEYVAELVIREKNSDHLNLKISMPTEEMASQICNNWQAHNQDIYAYLMEMLL
jgi:predicted transcriptional regulator